MKKILVALLVAMLALVTVALADQHGADTVEPLCAHKDVILEVVSQYPSCTETGTNDYICPECGVLVKSETVAATGHDWELVEHVDPWCESEGYDYYICKNLRCYETKTEAISALGHDWHFIRTYKPDTCTEIGLEYHECLRCDADKTVEIDMVHHNFVEIDNELPTCTEDGFVEYECTICTTTMIEIVDALGHNWTAWNIDEYPTCDKPGMRSRYCTRTCCYEGNIQNVVKETEVLEATGHLVDENYLVIEGNIATGICVKCSAVVVFEIEVEEPAPEVKPEDKPSTDNRPENKPSVNEDGIVIPATGETMNVAPFIMMLVAIVGLAVTKQKVTE